MSEGGERGREEAKRKRRERKKEKETNGVHVVHHTLPLKLPDIQQIS